RRRHPPRESATSAARVREFDSASPRVDDTGAAAVHDATAHSACRTRGLARTPARQRSGVIGSRAPGGALSWRPAGHEEERMRRRGAVATAASTAVDAAVAGEVGAVATKAAGSATKKAGRAARKAGAAAERAG